MALKQRWQTIVWEVLLATGAIIAMIWCVFEFNLLVIMSKRIGTWLMRAGRVVYRVIYRLFSETFWAFMYRKMFRPVWAGLGVEALMKWFVGVVVMDWCWRGIRPLFHRTRITSKKTWRWQPWYVKTILSLTGVAILIILSFGLFLVPLGLSTYGALIARAQAALGDSALQKAFKKKQRLRRVRMYCRCKVREYQNLPLVGRYRGLRYHLIWRDRRWQEKANGWVDEKIDQWFNHEDSNVEQNDWQQEHTLSRG